MSDLKLSIPHPIGRGRGFVAISLRRSGVLGSVGGNIALQSFPSHYARDRRQVAGAPPCPKENPMQKILSPLILLATVVIASGCTHVPVARQDACSLTNAPMSAFLMRVPFETVDGRIYVQSRVNGRGLFRFAVDTGASGLARADASLVSALGLAIQGQTSTSDGVQTAKVDTTHLDALELGSLTRRDLDVITRDYSSRKSPGSAFAGIIAREFFSDGLLIIDYPGKTLSFSRSLALSPSAKNVLTYERAFRVPVSIDGLQTEGNLDTGANVTFVLPQSLYEKVAASPLERAGNGQLTNGEIESNRATIRGPFRIGSLSLSNLEVRVAERFPELLVGAQALEGSVVLIDQRSKSIALCK
jgi:predicted aspartyl protease